MRGEGAPSLVMPARVYHREYKSVDEDQIGFQKYKIHGDIKKQKERQGLSSGKGKGETATVKELVGGTREAEVIGGHDSATAIQLVYANFGLIYTRRFSPSHRTYIPANERGELVRFGGYNSTFFCIYKFPCKNYVTRRETWDYTWPRSWKVDL